MNAPLLLRAHKLAPHARLPTKGHDDDLGWDLCALERVAVSPGAFAKIRTGIAMGFPPGVGGIVKDRSSMALRGLHTLAGVIDPGYRGEIIVVAVNLGSAVVDIAAGERFAQLILIHSLAATVTESEALDDTARGAGGFGSTGA